MKKSILLLAVLISIEGYSQIILDFQTPVPCLITVKLSNTTTKYTMDSNNPYFEDIEKFVLYNLDGTTYKTIYLPPKPDPSAQVITISHITSSLFDTDSTNIEYLINYEIDSAGHPYSYVQVVREDGTILLNEPKAMAYSGPPDFTSSSVYNTEEGPKLRLYYAYAYFGPMGTKVFMLPGTIPTYISDHNSFSNNYLQIYPNPNPGTFLIKFYSNPGEAKTINLYSTIGVLLNTFKSTENFIHLDNLDLPDGLYLINTRIHNQNLVNKLLITK